MTRLNNRLLLSFLLFTFLGLAFFYSTQKLLRLSFQHTVLYCQALIASFSLRIPHQFGFLLRAGLFLVAILTIFKLFWIYAGTRRLRKILISQKYSRRKFRLLLKKLNLSCKVDIIESHKPLAFCFGFRKPKIYLSEKLLSLVTTHELEAILIHEKYHLENRDSLIMFFAAMVQSLFPFFPVISDLIRYFRIEREIKADRLAAESLGGSGPIISVFRKLLKAPASANFYIPALADRDTLEPRIKALVNKDISGPKFKIINVIFSLITLVALGIMVFVPLRSVEVHADNQDVMMLCLAGNDCSNWCKEQQSVQRTK